MIEVYGEVERIVKYFMTSIFPLIGILIISIFFGIRATYDRVKYDGDHKQIRDLLDFIYHFNFHFLGSVLGWLLLYVLYERILSINTHVSKLQVLDFLLLLFGYLGITGHIPQTLYGFVLSFGKLTESIRKKIT